jgi:hypothetical protein
VSSYRWLRRARNHFGLSAPHVAVRARIPWRSAIGAAALTAIVLLAVWWPRYADRNVATDSNRHMIETDATALAASRREVAALRARISALESELAITRGAHDALARQATDLSDANAALRERTAFLEQLGSAGLKPAQVVTRR